MPSASLCSLSQIILDVSFFPSCPFNGESFIENTIDKVGGSIGMDFIGERTFVEAIVSATVATCKPAMAIISPHCALSTGIFFNPSNDRSFVRRDRSIIFPSALIAWTGSFIVACPVRIFPVKTRPRY